MDTPPRVLIVDDDTDTLRLYRFALGLMGCEVVVAQSGREALRAAVDVSPQVVVTDLAMPGMDGVQLCEELHAREDTRDIPVLAVSGQAVGRDRDRAWAAGFRDVLLKPCSPEELYATISRVVRDAETSSRPERRRGWAFAPPRHREGQERRRGGADRHRRRPQLAER